MFIKHAKMKLEASSVIDRDMLLYGSKRKAFIKHDISNNLIHASNSLDIVAELKDREPSEWIVFRARAIDAGGSDKDNVIYHGANDNGDYFSEEELLSNYEKTDLKSYETFINVPLFTNHQNGDIEQARGKVIAAFYDLDNHTVYTDCMIDAKAYPSLARGIREGYINDVSMGCSVKWSECSVCGNKAVTEKDYCLTAGTKITLGDYTIKNIEDIEVGDSVLTHDGSSQNVKELMVREINEPIYEIYVSGSNIPLEITGNHPVLALDKMDYRETWSKYYENNFNPKWKPAEKLNVGDYLLSPKYAKPSEKMTVGCEFARLAGIYLAEGNFVKSNGSLRGVEFNINSNEGIFRENIVELCEKLTNKSPKVYIRDSVCLIRIYDADLANSLKNICGEYSREKFIGNEIFNWCDTEIKEFICGYLDGDGYIFENKKIYLRTSSTYIALQMQKLLSVINSWCSIYNHENSENDIVKYVNNPELNDTWLIQIPNIYSYKIIKDSNSCIKGIGFIKSSTFEKSSHWNTEEYDVLKIRKISVKDFNGHVFNFSVENNENYIANNIIVHNCTHVANHKGKKIQGQKVYEKNHGIKFIELSAVTDGACENCTIQNAYSGEEFLRKLEDNVSGIVSKACLEVKQDLLKYKKAKSNSQMVKTARGEDVDKLNKALDNLREVADQILNSKAVDFEFLEKIGSLLADLQELIVDLVEAGFANEGGQAPASPGGPAPAEKPTPAAPSAGAAPAAPAAATPPATQPPLPSQNSQIMANIDGIQRIAKNNSRELEELLKSSLKIKEIVDGISILKEKISGGMDNMPTKKQLNRMSTSNAISEKFAEILDERLSENDPIVISDGPYSIKIDPDNGISGFIDNKPVVEASNEELGDDLVTMAKINPQVVAGRLIQVLSSKYNENGELKMKKGAANSDNIIKEALVTNPPPVDQVQEGQLDDLSGNFDRKNDPVKAEGQVGVTTEKQLDNVTKSKETGKGDWGRIRPDGVKENLEVTEGQLDTGRPTDFGSERKNSSTALAKDQLGSVQEGQLANYKDAKDGGSASRWHDATTPGDYLPTTEAQFEGKDRLGKAVNELQEGQLESHRQGDSGFAGSTDASPHKASREELIVTAIVNGLANTVLARRVSAKSLVAAKAGLVAPKSKISDYRFAGKTNWSVDEIRAVAQSAIVDELKSVVTFDDQEVDEALAAVYEVPETLEASVSNSVQEKIAELSNIQDVKTVEENKKASYLSALKKSAFKKEAALVHLSPENLRQLLGNGFSLNKIKDIDLEAKLSQLNPGVDFFDFSKAADGGWNIHSTKDANDLNLIGKEDVSNGIGSGNDFGNGGSNGNVIDVPSIDTPRVENTPMEQPAMGLAASKVDALKKLAQSPAGTTMPPPGGAPPAGGPPPAAGGAPGMESLTTAPPMEDPLGGDDELGEDSGDTDGEPKPFGSLCPRCGTEDVDSIEGHSKCNSCGLEFDTEINIKILNEGEETEGDEADSGDEMEPTEGENINDELEAPAETPGGAAPGGAGAPPPPGGGGMPGLAHSKAWLRTSFVTNPILFAKGNPFRFASIGKEVAPGHRCVSCGTTRVAFKDSNGYCLKCGNTYSVAVKRNGKQVVAEIYWTPNLALKEEPTIIEAEDGSKINLGYATKGEVVSASDVKKILHEILSSRDTMIKTAGSAYKSGNFDDLIVCQLDQCGRGYASGEARTICAAIKDSILEAQFESKDDSDDDDDDDNDEDDNVEFENDKVEDSNDGMSDNFGDDDDDDDSDDDGMEEITDGDESEEEDEFSDEPMDDVPGEMGGHSDAPKVQKIELYMEDKDGNQFEVEYDVSEIEPNTVEGVDDFDMSADEELDQDHELGNGMGDMTNGIEDDLGNADEVVIEEEIDDPSFSIKDLFAPKEEEMALLEAPRKPEMPMDNSSVMSLANQTSELLRGGRVLSSERSGGSNIDIDKVAQFLGIQTTMPNDTKVEVPRDEEKGIRDDGVVVSTHDHPNTAKKLADGKHRGSAYTDKDQAIDRGVEVIAPKAGRHATSSTMKKKAEEETIKPTPSGNAMNHASPDGTDQTPNGKGQANEEKKGDGKVKEKSNSNEPTPAGDDDNHAVEASSNPYVREAGKSCPKCSKKGMKKCSCMMKKKTKVEPKKDDKKKKKAGQDNWMKVAQHYNQQTEPIDGLQDEGKLKENKTDVPRDKSKAKPETRFERPKGVDNPIEVRKSEYGFGDKGKNLHTEVVPRDGSGDGLGGKSVSFEKEKGEDATSGNPDTYVQKYTKSEKPTPAGNEDNHATRGPNTASDKIVIRKIAAKECSSCGEERCPVCKGCMCKNNKCKCD